MPGISLIRFPEGRVSFTSSSENRHYDFSEILTAVQQSIFQLNRHIQAYNDCMDLLEKPNLLKNIYQFRQQMNNRFPLDFISSYLPYQEQIHTQLWREIQTELKSLNLPSVTTLIQSSAVQTEATEFISNMSQDKVAKLMKILWENRDVPTELRTLFRASEPGFAEFKKILEHSRVEVISGGGNSRNLKIENHPPDGTPALILKVDARLGNPKENEQHLREHSFEHLTQIYGTERQASFKSSGKTITANLLFTDYCPGGSLLPALTTGAKPAPTPSQRVNTALNYYQQMTTILLDMQSKGIAFLDAKNTNWLIDADGKLHIADTKSFLECNPSTTLVREGVERNRFAQQLKSIHLCPIEFYTARSKPYSADKMHTYMVGKNLFQYLTGCRSLDLLDRPLSNQSEFKPKYAFNESDFTHAVFKTPEGLRLQRLIEKMVQPKPEARIGLHQALLELNSINAFKESKISLERIKRLRPNYPDLGEIEQRIHALGDSNDLQKLKIISAHLNQVCDSVELAADCKAMYAELKKFKETPEDPNDPFKYQKYTEMRDKLNLDEVKGAIITAEETYDLLGLAEIKDQLTKDKEAVCDRFVADAKGLLRQIEGTLDEKSRHQWDKGIKESYKKKDLNALQDLYEKIYELVSVESVKAYTECRALYEKHKAKLNEPEKKEFKTKIREAYNNNNLLSLKKELSSMRNRFAPIEHMRFFAAVTQSEETQRAMGDTDHIKTPRQN